MADENKKHFDDEVKALIIEALGDNKTGGGDIDALFRIKSNFRIIEFLKCDTVRPFYSHPNRYWHYNNPGKTGNKNKFISLWNVAQKTGSALYLVNYEDSRVQFKVMKVTGLIESKGITTEEYKCNFEEFKKWFNSLIEHSA